MSIIAIVGDCTTTTALAMASAWPVDDDVVILEADRTGGSLAAWLDTPATPSLSTIVANTHALDPARTSAWFTVDSMIRSSASGIRFIASSFRACEANRSIGEANTVLFPLLASMPRPVFLADVGRLTAIDAVPPVLALAEAIIVCHRQVDATAAAGAVRLERLVDLVNVLSPIGVPLVVALIGSRPFDVDEVDRFVSGDGRHHLTTHQLADDVLTAAVFAGRTGVSARRLNRLPLIRSARGLVGHIRPNDPPSQTDDWFERAEATP